jgi:hypothetical protein
MVLILWILGIVIIASMVRMLLQRAPKTGKPLLLIVAVVVVVLAAIALALSGLWPVAMSLVGGLAVYGKPILRAFGLWLAIKRFRKPNANPGSKGPAQNLSPMDKAQARKILEVRPNASIEDITMAHKRLMAKNHPDKGGSTYLASQINQAKDVLLN